MVAFIGAVICIIAAVHTASPAAAAAQPLADNQSLSPDAGTHTSPPGSMGRAGPLDALHGTETTGGQRSIPEAPTFYGVSGPPGVGGAGGSGQQVTYSRLICTPIRAGECKPKNFQQQADEPPLYAGEDWGFLRTTAEELRQTVLQQKDEILTDQRTIRELTGKLSDCERLEARSNPEMSAGLWGGKRGDKGHLMVRDDTASSMLTAQAVEELEQAIIHLKDRIEKLESEMGPLAHNHTDVGHHNRKGSAPGHSGAPSGQRVEDLEGELERKMELLEKERKALRRESQRQRHEIDLGVNNLHHRIRQLEQGLSEYSYPEGYKLSFPVRTASMYGLVRHPVPALHAFTTCLWLRPTEAGIGTFVSYAASGQLNELVLLQGVHSPAELLVNNKVAQLPLNLSLGSWHHICVSWKNKGGVWKAYQGGKLRGEGKGLAAWHSIRPGGVLILGQDQDSLGGRFDASQALVGELSQFNLWDRVLTPTEVSNMANCSEVMQGNVAPWADSELDVFGGAIKEPLEPCFQRLAAQQ